MRIFLVAWLLSFFASVAGADDGRGIAPLQMLPAPPFTAVISNDILFLDDAPSIETFLTGLDGQPPDWTAVYGSGHHDPGHDDRLFALNRERDAGRAGNPSLLRRIAFRWSGELSQFDPETRGFSVALGPVFTSTGWGQVRFKPDDLPGELKVIPPEGALEGLQRELSAGKVVELAVIIIGKLVPEESIVYDFSHDQEGLGLIMPFVRVEEIRYILVPQG